MRIEKKCLWMGKSLPAWEAISIYIENSCSSSFAVSVPPVRPQCAAAKMNFRPKPDGNVLGSIIRRFPDTHHANIFFQIGHQLILSAVEFVRRAGGMGTSPTMIPSHVRSHSAVCGRVGVAFLFLFHVRPIRIHVPTSLRPPCITHAACKSTLFILSLQNGAHLLLLCTVGLGKKNSLIPALAVQAKLCDFIYYVHAYSASNFYFLRALCVARPLSARSLARHIFIFICELKLCQLSVPPARSVPHRTRAATHWQRFGRVECVPNGDIRQPSARQALEHRTNWTVISAFYIIPRPGCHGAWMHPIFQQIIPVFNCFSSSGSFARMCVVCACFTMGCVHCWWVNYKICSGYMM